MGVQRPDWPYPERCGNGHEWGRPGGALVTWKRCLCPGAQTLHPHEAIWGHFVVACREPGCRSVWYDPPHEPRHRLASRALHAIDKPLLKLDRSLAWENNAPAQATNVMARGNGGCDHHEAT